MCTKLFLACSIVAFGAPLAYGEGNNESSVLPTAAEVEHLPTFGDNFKGNQVDLDLTLIAYTDEKGEGVSTTNGQPGVFVQAGPTYGPFYANGYWANSYTGEEGENDETGYNIGFRPTMGRFSLDLTYWDYFVEERQWRYDEIFANLGYSVTDKLMLGVNYSWTDNYSNIGVVRRGERYYVSYSLTDKLSVSGGYDFFKYGQFIDGDSNYNHWHAGASFVVNPTLTFDLRWSDTNRSREECGHGTDWCEGSVVLTAVISTSARKLFGVN